MANPYSVLKNALKINVDHKTDDGLASLTHYFQCHSNGVSQYFQPAAEKYLQDFLKENNFARQPVNSLVPIEWDIPFPQPKKPKFNFVDLFAGIGGIRMAFQNLGGKCVFSSEWNPLQNSLMKQTLAKFHSVTLPTNEMGF